MAWRRSLVMMAITAVAWSCKMAEPPASSLAIAPIDFCDTKLAKDIVRIQPAKFGSTVVYTIEKGACRNGKAKFSLAEPSKDPVIILWHPSQTNLSAKDYERLKEAGIVEPAPVLEGKFGNDNYFETQDMRPKERLILGSSAGDKRAYPESAFAEREAMTLYQDLKKAGVPVTMINASQDDAAITRETREFLERTGGGDTLRVVPIGHGIEGQDGKHKMVATSESIRVGQTPEGPVVTDQKITPSAVNTVDKINAVMAGSNLPGQCMVKSCYSGTIVDDGLSQKVEQLMTFSSSNTTASAIPSNDPRYVDGSIPMMRDYLAGRVGDKNGDGTQDLLDLRQHFADNGEQFKITEPQIEVRPNIYTTEGQDPAFVAVERDRPQGVPNGAPETYEEVPVYINGRPATADIRITPTEVNELQQINVYERQGDGYRDVTPPPPPTRDDGYEPRYGGSSSSYGGYDAGYGSGYGSPAADMPMQPMGSPSIDSSSL